MRASPLALDRAALDRANSSGVVQAAYLQDPMERTLQLSKSIAKQSLKSLMVGRDQYQHAEALYTQLQYQLALVETVSKAAQEVGGDDIEPLATAFCEQELALKNRVERGHEYLQKHAPEPCILTLPEEEAIYVTGVLIEDALAMCEQKMQDRAIYMAAHSVVEEFGRYLTPTEVALVLRDGITGKFGQVYGKVSVTVICGWFKSYVDQKVEAYKNKELDRSSQYSVDRTGFGTVESLRKSITK